MRIMAETMTAGILQAFKVKDRPEYKPQRPIKVKDRPEYKPQRPIEVPSETKRARSDPENRARMREAQEKRARKAQKRLREQA